MIKSNSIIGYLFSQKPNRKTRRSQKYSNVVESFDQRVLLSGSSLQVGDSLDNTLTGTENRDVLIGNDGNDTLAGNGGNDTLIGGDGNDFVTGGIGRDVLTGDSGNDTLIAGDENDTLNGGSGDDFLDGGLGRDVIIGGNGIDAASFESLNVAVTVDLTRNSATSNDVRDTVVTVENIIGTSFGDTIVGDKNNNIVSGQGDVYSSPLR